MDIVLILYPGLFNCYSKFFRKIERILSSLDSVKVLYPSDPNGFIQKAYENTQLIDFIHKSESWAIEDITHAIVFDDGEMFTDELNLLKSSGKPLRFIKIAITRVINIKRDTKYKGGANSPNYEYIGRGSYWGNPYSMYEDGEDRDEVIRKFKYDFDFEKFPYKDKKEVYKLVGKRLGCFCKPLPCHGDILADFLNSWDDGK